MASSSPADKSSFDDRQAIWSAVRVMDTPLLTCSIERNGTLPTAPLLRGTH